MPLARAEGLEPPTSRFGDGRSTLELRPIEVPLSPETRTARQGESLRAASGLVVCCYPEAPVRVPTVLGWHACEDGAASAAMPIPRSSVLRQNFTTVPFTVH